MKELNYNTLDILSAHKNKYICVGGWIMNKTWTEKKGIVGVDFIQQQQKILFYAK